MLTEFRGKSPSNESENTIDRVMKKVSEIESYAAQYHAQPGYEDSPFLSAFKTIAVTLKEAEGDFRKALSDTQTQGWVNQVLSRIEKNLDYGIEALGEQGNSPAMELVVLGKLTSEMLSLKGAFEGMEKRIVSVMMSVLNHSTIVGLKAMAPSEPSPTGLEAVLTKG